MKRRRRRLARPESIEGVIERAGEDRFARRRAPISEAIWRRAVGARIADRARPMELERGLLTVRVATAMWSTELSLLETTIVERLRDEGLDVVRLRFRVGAIEPPARPPERRISRAVPAPVALPASLATAMSHVEDDELRAAMETAAKANLAWQAHTQEAPDLKIHARVKVPR